jgi:hypothetical protein
LDALGFVRRLPNSVTPLPFLAGTYTVAVVFASTMTSSVKLPFSLFQLLRTVRHMDLCDAFTNVKPSTG